MYIGKYARAEEPEAQEEIVTIPRNYAGNAFAPPKEQPQSKEDGCTAMPHVAENEETLRGLDLQRLLSPDTLLFLLSILLSSGEEGGDLSLLLLLLLLF